MPGERVLRLMFYYCFCYYVVGVVLQRKVLGSNAVGTQCDCVCVCVLVSSFGSIDQPIPIRWQKFTIYDCCCLCAGYVSLHSTRNHIHYKNCGIWFECMRCVKTADNDTTHILIIIVVIVFICFWVLFHSPPNFVSFFFVLPLSVQHSHEYRHGNGKFCVYPSYGSSRFPNSIQRRYLWLWWWTKKIYDTDHKFFTYVFFFASWRSISSHNSNFPAIDPAVVCSLMKKLEFQWNSYVCFCGNRRNLNATQ